MPPVKRRYIETPKKDCKLNEKVQKETVGVYLRLRPTLSSKTSLVRENDQQVRTLPLDENVQPKYYSFTGVFDNATQDDVFKKVALPVLKDVITSGKDGLIFSYGVTGSGKTYTMQGSDSEPGLIQRSIYYLFESIRERLRKEGSVIRQQEDNAYVIKNPLYPDLSCPALSCTTPSWQKWLNGQKIVAAPDAQYCLFMSLIELYNKEVNDLFEDDKQEKKGEKIKRCKKLHYDPKTDKTFVVNAREIEVRSADQAVKEYLKGVSRRSVGPTALNDKSSRGHCVLFLKLIHIGRAYDGKPSLTSSQLCLVDLAGSERTKESGVTGGAREETGSINNSLSALRRCFVALHNRQPIINYREHTLTRLFKSYFEGKGKVRMILCVNPATNLNENLHVLEFGRYIQDVTVDFATPFKQVVNSKFDILMQEYLNRQPLRPDQNSNLSDKEFIANWISTLKKNRDMKRSFMKTAEEVQFRVREEIEHTIKDNQSMKKLYESRSKDLEYKDEQLDLVKNSYDEELKTMLRQLNIVKNEKDRQMKKLSRSEKLVQELRNQYEKIIQDVVSVMDSEEYRNIHLKRRLEEVLQKSIHPSAPEIEPLQSSSPMELSDPSTPEIIESNSPQTTSSPSDQTVYHAAPLRRSPVKYHFSALDNGVQVVNRRRAMSQPCCDSRIINHVPKGTVDTKTFFQFDRKKGRSVKNLRNSDIIGKAGSHYALVNQTSNIDGELQTDVVKGRILDTVCGGANVIFTDIETMKQISPPSSKRIRASSDASFTR